MRSIPLLISFCLVPALAFAHPGALDSDCGHKDLETGGYHFHDGCRRQSPPGEVPSYSKGCEKDADCRLIASYCETDPCSCHAIRVGAEYPSCEGGTVNCFAYPCQFFRAVCKENVCELESSDNKR